MKTTKLFLTLLLSSVMGLSVSCQSGTNQERVANASDNGEVKVYYFHNKARCVTCKTVEEVSGKLVFELYGDSVPFTALELGTPEADKVSKEIGVNMQALVIVGAGQKIDITPDAFMNARSNPAKLKEIFKEKIDPLI
ncbi:MAG: nitrophenyl compound nitroreductase subunit ArsF family protein [Bacteroidales bacterium]|nr:nitrophenyl compound nitroreductase subunit ArsF family protein [Bacteroidales bacterium]